jgi:hypothetical protein
MSDATPEDRQAAADYLNQLFGKHDEHTWTQVGRCVYCADCNQRLYQGTIPATHTKVKQPQNRSWDDAQDPVATRNMRARWGKS